jgi:hypothetical protein
LRLRSKALFPTIIPRGEGDRTKYLKTHPRLKLKPSSRIDNRDAGYYEPW